MAKERKQRIVLPPGWRHQKITPRMKKACDRCDQPIVGKVRVKHVAKTRPFPTESFYCAHCAVFKMNEEVQAQLTRINYFVVRLASGDV